MTGPKHLWSGDWERESRRAADHPPVLVEEPAAAEPEPSARRRLSPRQILAGLVAGLLAAAVAFALVSTLGGNSKPRSSGNPRTPTAHAQGSGGVRASPGQTQAQPPNQSPNRSQSCQQSSSANCSGAPAKVVAGPTAQWLGMQIVTSPAGVAISSVRLGSPADAAGFEPGDVIMAVGDEDINAVPQIRSATAKLALNSLVRIEVLRGSTSMIMSAVPMRERPTIHP